MNNNIESVEPNLWGVRILAAGANQVNRSCCSCALTRKSTISAECPSQKATDHRLECRLSAVLKGRAGLLKPSRLQRQSVTYPHFPGSNNRRIHAGALFVLLNNAAQNRRARL